jgi:hypothetical protein
MIFEHVPVTLIVQAVIDRRLASGAFMTGDITQAEYC